MSASQNWLLPQRLEHARTSKAPIPQGRQELSALLNAHACPCSDSPAVTHCPQTNRRGAEKQAEPGRQGPQECGMSTRSWPDCTEEWQLQPHLPRAFATAPNPPRGCWESSATQVRRAVKPQPEQTLKIQEAEGWSRASRGREQALVHSVSSVHTAPSAWYRLTQFYPGFHHLDR